MARLSKFPAKAAALKSFYLLTGAGAATILTDHLLNPNSLVLNPNDLKAVLNGVVSSSRVRTVNIILIYLFDLSDWLCFFLFNLSVVDYKYSLHGLSVYSDEHNRVFGYVINDGVVLP